MVGDEGCQLRTPFTLDLYELVHDQLNKSPYQSSASHIPFSIKHIYASTYRRENEISQHYAASSKGVKAGKRHKFSELNRHDH